MEPGIKRKILLIASLVVLVLVALILTLLLTSDQEVKPISVAPKVITEPEPMFEEVTVVEPKPAVNEAIAKE